VKESKLRSNLTVTGRTSYAGVALAASAVASAGE
jgi:hypothetical protein